MSEIKYFAQSEFLYKPTFFKKVYIGEDMINYSNERQEELSLSGALDIHNLFWRKHPVSTGTVYGAIPCKYIDWEITKLLIKFGWRRAKVDIYIFRSDIKPDRQRVIAERQFSKFILTKANLENPALLIVFKSFESPTAPKEVNFE